MGARAEPRPPRYAPAIVDLSLDLASRLLPHRLRRVPAMFGCIRVLLTAACVLAAVVACTLDVVRGFPLVETSNAY